MPHGSHHERKSQRQFIAIPLVESHQLELCVGAMARLKSLHLKQTERGVEQAGVPLDGIEPVDPYPPSRHALHKHDNYSLHGIRGRA